VGAGPDEKVSEPQAVEVVSYLLDAGAHIDDRDARGRTALMIAAEGGRAEIANLLLARGADPSLKDKAGKVPQTLQSSLLARAADATLNRAQRPDKYSASAAMSSERRCIRSDIPGCCPGRVRKSSIDFVK